MSIEYDCASTEIDLVACLACGQVYPNGMEMCPSRYASGIPHTEEFMGMVARRMMRRGYRRKKKKLKVLRESIVSAIKAYKKLKK